VHDDPAERAFVARAARDADDIVAYSVLEAALVYAQNLDAAAQLAPRYDVARSRTDIASAMRGLARRVVASLDVIAGRWDAPYAPPPNDPADPQGWRIEAEALQAAEPLMPVPRPRIAALRDSVLARHPYFVYRTLTMDSSALTGAEMQAYLAGLLSVRLGDRPGAEASIAQLAAGGDGGRAQLAAMLASALRAELKRSRGDVRGALAELDGFDLMPAVGRLRLPLHWGVRERFLRAELLLALGRDDEAAQLYDSFESVYDAAYLAPAHLRRAQIHARHGELEQARFHYGRFLSMWRDCDPAFRPLVEQARQELAALPAASQ
jgi:tetratricopeptide (TPR) repeat protein